MDGVVSKNKYTNVNNQKKDYTQTTYIQSVKDNIDKKRDRNFLYQVYQLGRAYDSDELAIGKTSFEDKSCIENSVIEIEGAEELALMEEKKIQSVDDFASNDEKIETLDENSFVEDESENAKFSFSDMPIFANKSIFVSKYIATRFAAVVCLVVVGLGIFLFVGTSLAVKSRVETAPQKAILSIKSAMHSLNKKDFTASGKEINQAYEEFAFASNEINKIGNFAIFLSRFIPGASKLSSGSNIIEAGKYLTHSAQELHDIIPKIVNDGGPLMSGDKKQISFLILYQLIADKMEIVYNDVKLARSHIDNVYIDDLPIEYRDTFLEMKELMPDLEQSIENTVASRSAIEDILGANGKRTYLFLFQNNHEMRATGGFIGSYGILKINNGQIEKLVIDDIFNPDGQLIDKIVPPLPIQKISANWSLHDSNWFVDFPVSAKKAIDFYERTGGPTVDGVVAITPAMMEKFLDITGPIKLSQYNMVLTSDNFMEIMQSEVEDEENYKTKDKNIEKESKVEDKKNNKDEKKQPKKVLSDLMPIMIDKLTTNKDPKNIAKLVSAVSSGLKERHIIMYMTNENAQNIINKNGWSGEVLQTDKDYLSVINTNINGFKTDGVIDETITHTAQIDKNGYIIDTVEIKRKHQGGKTGFPWWDAVNSDYMRIYVPKGSKLISVEGNTREINEERLNYDELGYKRDKDVQKEENNIHIDDETGTRIYDEYGKTVFANWVYVSPQESVTVKYKYKLPFKVKFESDEQGKFGSYAVLFQKQSGSEKTVIESNIILDDKLSNIWSSQNNNELIMKNNLKIDRYNGVVFRAH